MVSMLLELFLCVHFQVFRKICHFLPEIAWQGRERKRTFLFREKALLELNMLVFCLPFGLLFWVWFKEFIYTKHWKTAVWMGRARRPSVSQVFLILMNLKLFFSCFMTGICYWGGLPFQLSINFEYDERYVKDYHMEYLK